MLIERQLTPEQHEDGLQRYYRAVALLEEHGIVPLEKRELGEVSLRYMRDLGTGLAQGGLESSLQMIPTGLKPVESKQLSAGDEALVIEVGGTNLRGAIVRVRDDHTIEIKKDESERYLTQKWEKRQFSGVEEFFDTIISSMERLLKDSQPKAVAVIYSFPGIAETTNDSLDVRSTEAMTKDFVVPGINQVLVGSEIMSRLTAKGWIGGSLPYVVMNDTPAVLLSHDGASLGGVVASGSNLAFLLNGVIYNTESGGFSAIPQHDAAEAVDLLNEEGGIGRQLAEKQISGDYLAQQLMVIISALNREGLIKVEIGRELTSGFISQLLRMSPENIMELESSILGTADSYDLAILSTVVARLRMRSAQIVGAMIGALIVAIEGQDKEEFTIPIEGPVFWDVPQYEGIVREIAEDISSKRVRFIEKKHAGIIGAGAAALSMLRRE